MARLSPSSLVGDTGRAKQDNGAAAAGNYGLPPTPFHGTAADERHLGAREERAREREKTGL